jgi:hypothetical protein
MAKEEEIETPEEIIEKILPEEKDQVKQLVTGLTNELMEKDQQLRMLQKELKQAIKRKKPKYDPRLGKVAMVMFSRPKEEDAKIRMHTADKVQANLALQTVKNMLSDSDNDFIGAYFLCPMKGYDDGYERLQTNAEAAWHLFELLDKDLKTQDPDAKNQDTGQEDEEKPQEEE